MKTPKTAADLKEMAESALKQAAEMIAANPYISALAKRERIRELLDRTSTAIRSEREKMAAHLTSEQARVSAALNAPLPLDDLDGAKLLYLQNIFQRRASAGDHESLLSEMEAAIKAGDKHLATVFIQHSDLVKNDYGFQPFQVEKLIIQAKGALFGVDAAEIENKLERIRAEEKGLKDVDYLITDLEKSRYNEKAQRWERWNEHEHTIRSKYNIGEYDPTKTPQSEW